MIASTPVGIDIEPLKARNGALFNLFSSHEWERLGSQDWLQFYRLWTAKEALSKKIGIGLDALAMMELLDATPETLTLSYRGLSHPVGICTHEDYVYAYTL